MRGPVQIRGSTFSTTMWDRAWDAPHSALTRGCLHWQGGVWFQYWAPIFSPQHAHNFSPLKSRFFMRQFRLHDPVPQTWTTIELLILTSKWNSRGVFNYMSSSLSIVVRPKLKARCIGGMGCCLPGLILTGRIGSAF